MLIRYKGQLYRRIDSANHQDIVKYLELNKSTKEATLKFAKGIKGSGVNKDAKVEKDAKEYLKAIDEAIRHLKSDKINDAKRALETAIKHSTNSHDSTALKSVIQKLK